MYLSNVVYEDILNDDKNVYGSDEEDPDEIKEQQMTAARASLLDKFFKIEDSKHADKEDDAGDMDDNSGEGKKKEIDIWELADKRRAAAAATRKEN